MIVIAVASDPNFCADKTRKVIWLKMDPNRSHEYNILEPADLDLDPIILAL